MRSSHPAEGRRSLPDGERTRAGVAARDTVSIPPKARHCHGCARQHDDAFGALRDERDVRGQHVAGTGQ